jgi:TolA-binding protein
MNVLYLLGHVAASALCLGCIGWVGWRWLRGSANPKGLIVSWVISAILILGVVLVAVPATGRGGWVAWLGIAMAAVCAVFVGVMWAPHLADFVANPLTNALTGGNEEVEPQPYYAIAQARRKRGEYLEAIGEIEKQLEKFPTDVTGWMLLAEVQAESLHDLPAARQTIEQLLSQPGHTPKNVAFALNRLADWHLKLAADPDAARTALERIVSRFPESAEAQMATQRLAHLGTPEFLAEKQERPRIALPKFEGNLGLKPAEAGAAPPDASPEVLAAQYVQHLEAHPLDNEARERLALVYADHYQRLDLALDQLEQLIGQPNAPARQVARWLNLVADLQIQKAANPDAARAALQRIQERFPNSAAAESARNRAARLDRELKGTQQRQALKLGVYEQNLGLKPPPASASP